MPIKQPLNYKTETARYNFYYRRLKVFYQKPVVQVSAAVIFTLFTIIFFAIFAIRPTLTTISELLSKIDSQEKVLAKAENKAAALGTAQQLYSQISDKIVTLDAAVPPEYQVQELLLYLESTAAELSVPISNISVSEIEFPLPSKLAGSAQEMNFTISFDANYPDAKIIINHLNQLPRLITFDSISMGVPKTGSRTSQGASIDTLQVSLNCRAFYYPEKS